MYLFQEFGQKYLLYTKEISFLPDVGSNIGQQSKIPEATLYNKVIYEPKSPPTNIDVKGIHDSDEVVLSWNETCVGHPLNVWCVLAHRHS